MNLYYYEPKLKEVIMAKIGIASADITPKESVWLTGYGSRDHKSEGVYQSLIAGVVAS